MFKYMFLISIIFFTGCTNINNTLMPKEKEIVEENFTTKEYANISKDAIFEAAKKIFLYSGKGNFRIDSYRNKLHASKTKVSHFPLFALTTEDSWILYVDEEKDISKAKLEVFTIKDFDEENPKYLDKKAHELLWNRIDYLLGLRNDWDSCSNSLSYFSSYSALCDSIDMPKPIKYKKEDIIEKILISDRKDSKSVDEIDEDILKNDIDFSIDDTNNDLLKNEEEVQTQTDKEKVLNDTLEKEIEELDKRVNTNIDETLDKIEQNIEDEPTLDNSK